MNIKEILELEDKYPVPVVDRCLIKKIGEAGVTQVLTLKDGKDILRVSLKHEGHFLDPDEDTGKWLKIMSGKPVNNKPTGIVTRVADGKTKLLVSEKATLSLVTEEEEKPQLTEKFNNANPRLEENEDPVWPQAEGPSDDFIINNIHARAHLSALFEKVESEDPTKFTFITDRQAFITSLYMDCVNTGHKILPPAQKEKKERFAKYEKPAVEKPAPQKKAITTKRPESSNDIIVEAVKTCKMASLKTVYSKQGVPAYDLLLDPETRAKTYRWYWMNREEDCGKLEPLRDALKNFYALVSSPLKRELCSEAIRMDISILCKVAYDDEDAVNACLVEIMKDMKAKEIGSSFAIEFFGKLKEARTIDYPVS